MSEERSVWVLGHKIRMLDTDESYGLVEITSPPRVPGPPPHFHKREHEFFLVVSGCLEVMVDGTWTRLAAGDYRELSPGSVHTFINNTEQDVVWLTGWRPKGFQRFFRDFGVEAVARNAQEESLDPALVQKVVRSTEAYGMFLKP